MATPRPWDGEPTPPQLALARGHRWLAMLESGNVKSLKEIAKQESVDTSYVSPMVNLTALVPGDRRGDTRRDCGVTLFDLAVDPPALWEEQRRRIGMLL